MIITLINQKGGCGKTTTAQVISCGLHRRGYKVLVIDADPQSNISYSSGIGEVEKDLYKLLNGEISIEEAIIETTNFDIIAGSVFLSNASYEYDTLGKAIEPIKNNYDFIIIDTPPIFGDITANALSCSDRAIIPTQAEIYSFQGISRVIEFIDNAKTVNSNLKISGVLLTRFSERTNVNRLMKELIKESLNSKGIKLYNATVREGTAVKEAQLLRSDIFSESPKAKVTQDYNSFIEEFLKEEGLNNE